MHILFFQGGNIRVNSKLSAYYSSSMLPPPPPSGPMARPVTIIRSTDMSGNSGHGNSPPHSSNTPPLTSNQESSNGGRDSRSLSPTVQQGNDQSPSSRSSFVVSRDYSLSHLHSQPSGQVSIASRLE